VPEDSGFGAADIPLPPFHTDPGIANETGDLFQSESGGPTRSTQLFAERLHMRALGYDVIDRLCDLTGALGRNRGRIFDGLPGILTGDTKLAGQKRHGDPPTFHVVPDPGHHPVNIRLFLECHISTPVERIHGEVYV
jgi:hypothetical protein